MCLSCDGVQLLKAMLLVFLFFVLSSLGVSPVSVHFAGQPVFWAEAVLKLLRSLRHPPSATQAVCGGWGNAWKGIISLQVSPGLWFLPDSLVSPTCLCSLVVSQRVDYISLSMVLLLPKISSLKAYSLYHLPKTKFTTSGQKNFDAGTWGQRNPLGKNSKSSLCFFFSFLFFSTMQ